MQQGKANDAGDDRNIVPRVGAETGAVGTVPRIAETADVPTETEVALTGASATAADVKTRAMSSARYIGFSSVVAIVLKVVSALVTARVLFPEDYGLFNVIAHVTGLGMLLSSGGLGFILLTQKEEPSDDEKATVFWLQQIITTVVVVALIGLLPLVASFYKVNLPGLIWPYVVQALAIYLFLVRSVTVLIQERNMHFGFLSRFEMIESVVQAVTAIVLALCGVGVWVLVGSGFLTRLITTIYIFKIDPPLFLRGKFRWDIARTYFRKAFPFLTNMMVPPLLQQFVIVVILRMLGEASLGLLVWAGNMMIILSVITGVLNRITLPSFSRLHNADAEMGRYTMLMGRRMIIIFSVALIPMAVLFPVVVPIVFGNQWNGAIPILQVILFDSTNVMLIGVLGQALVAAQLLTERFIASIIAIGIRIGATYAMILLFGKPGMVYGQYIGTLAELILLLIYLHKRVSGCESIFQEILRPLLFLQGAAGFAIMAQILHSPSWSSNAHTTPMGILVGLLVGGVLVYCYDLLSPEKPVTQEARAIWAMVQGQVKKLRPKVATA